MNASMMTGWGAHMKPAEEWIQELGGSNTSTFKDGEVVAEVCLTTNDIRAIQKDAQVLNGHAGDCTFFSAVSNGRPYDGICTCGYGWQEARKVSVAERDESKLVSQERKDKRTITISIP
jgi:hypothetical protein